MFKKIALLTISLTLILLAAACGGSSDQSAPEKNAGPSPAESRSEPSKPAAVPATKSAPAPAPKPEPEPEPITLSGQGDQATQLFDLAGGVTVIQAKHQGQRNFALWLMDGQGNKVELLVNTIGAYGGYRMVEAEKGRYLLEVTADGAWEIKVTQPRPAGGQKPPAEVKGAGDGVVGPLELGRGLARAEMAHQGERNFAVWLYDGKGNKTDLLANEIGSYQGSKAPQIRGAGIYYLDIQADGDWTVKITQ